LETEIGYVFKRDAAGCIVLDDSISKAQRTQLESEGFAVKKVGRPSHHIPPPLFLPCFWWGGLGWPCAD
jgi:hypothetical protein